MVSISRAPHSLDWNIEFNHTIGCQIAERDDPEEIDKNARMILAGLYAGALYGGVDPRAHLRRNITYLITAQFMAVRIAELMQYEVVTHWHDTLYEPATVVVFFSGEIVHLARKLENTGRVDLMKP